VLFEAALEGGAAVRVDAEGWLVVDRPGTETERFELAPTVRWPTPVTGCAARSGASALVGLARFDAAIFVPARDLGCRRVDLGPRLAGSEAMQITPISFGFVVVLECGVLCIDDGGRECWRLDRVTVGWRFVAERDAAIWLEDHEGELVGFEAATGFERL